jgi:hypothetical protein
VRFRQRFKFIFVLALLAACIPAAAARAQTPTFVASASSSTASGGRFLWADCESACTLYTNVGGVTTRLPIAPVGVAGDIQQASLGVGPSGHQLAAYSRCVTSLRDCDIYIYDFVTGQERRLAVSNHPGALMTPTVSGDRVAYAYNPKGHDGPARKFAIYWSYLNGTKMDRVHTEPLESLRDQPTLSLNGTRLAYVGDSRLTSCLDQSHVRIATLGTNRDVLVAAGDTRTDVFSPQWDGNTLIYGRDFFKKWSYRHDWVRGEIVGTRVERYNPATGVTTATGGYSRMAAVSLAADDSGIAYQLVTGIARTSGIYLGGMPTFHRIKAQRKLQRR